MKNLEKRNAKGKAKEREKVTLSALKEAGDLDIRVNLIQSLIPLGLKAVEEELQQEVLSLAGGRYERGSALSRWGSNPGSVYLGDQKVRVTVPRVRNRFTQEEVRLESYQALQNPSTINDLALNRVLYGLSTRKYEKAALSVPETFGVSKSSVSRKFIEASAEQLKAFQERSLETHDIVAIFIDGKHFGNSELLIAMGVTLTGEKVILGFIESSTENHVVCREFLQGLQKRGLTKRHPLLFIIDGAKGLKKGIQEVFGHQAFIQRCQWHKRENVLSYLPRSQQELFRKKLQKAYQTPDYDEAKKQLLAIAKELQPVNLSAVTSLKEGMEETLTLQKLGLFSQLGTSLKTTNCIESINSSIQGYTQRIRYWKNSSQKQRWVAAALLEIEPKLRRVKGFRYLKMLRQNMKTELETQAFQKLN